MVFDHFHSHSRFALNLLQLLQAELPAALAMRRPDAPAIHARLNQECSRCRPQLGIWTLRGSKTCGVVLWFVAATSLVRAAECGMSLSLSHADPAKTSIYAAETGVASLYYSAKLAVNTDGSSRSYHPDDPRAQRLALNNIANAISAIHGPDGSNLDCSPRRGACFQTYIEAFEKARDGKWKPSGTYRIKTDGMIPWKKDAVLGWNVPCTIPSGKSAGYFVSQTSFLLDPSKPVCDQERYLDSLTYNAIVLPRGTKWASQKQIAKDGDLVVVQNLKNRAIAFAIVGDRGPAKDLGEGTIALAARLGQKTLSGQETYGEIKKLALPQVQYLVFPGVSIGKTKAGGFLQSDVDQAGQELLDRWGGISRLDACGTLKRD